MCIAIPLEVIKINDSEALVHYKGVKMNVNISLLENVTIGDFVLVHAGCAIEKMDKEEARKTIILFNQLSISESIGEI
jgi:hydrogenase expression/formation protein HypC